MGSVLSVGSGMRRRLSGEDRSGAPTAYWALGREIKAAIAAFLLLLPFGGAPAQAGSEAHGATAPVTILALGDSLTAGYELAEADSFAAQLERALVAQGLEARVINAGVSGDTTAGGLARLGWALADRPDLVIVELGANDALRGLEPSETRRNLDLILQQLTGRDAAVLLAGMRAPPNLGAEFAAEFDVIYPELAAHHGVTLYPFFLDGVAAEPALNLPDGMHPNAAGVARIVEGILPYVLRALRLASASG